MQRLVGFLYNNIPKLAKGIEKKHHEKDKNHILSQTTIVFLNYIFSHCFSDTSFFLHYGCEEHTS